MWFTNNSKDCGGYILKKIPCNHFMCFGCFAKSPSECMRCEDLIDDFKRIPDSEDFWACENEICKRYYEDPLKYEKHMTEHAN